jgi:PucR family transcriptional regulator, purine catabolism regulatory protein
LLSMPLTLREVLELEVVRRGSPLVVAGEGRLDVRVRWVHAAELPDVGRLLRGGELLLSTGIALPSSPPELADYVRSLSSVGVTGLAIELGRRFFGSLPRVLVDAATERDLPLIELRREVAFVEITETVHARILDEVLLERAAATLALGRLLTSRQPESLERQAHRTLISAIISLSGQDAGGAGAAGATESEVGARARSMGIPVTGRQLVALVVRLPDSGVGPGPGGGLGTEQAAGLAAGPAPILGVAEALAGACRAARVPALVGALDDLRAGALLSLPQGANADASLRAVAARLAARSGRAPWSRGPSSARGASAGPEPGSSPGHVIGVGAPSGSLRQVRDGFREAREVADVAIGHAGVPDAPDGRDVPDGPRPYYRLADLRLRGLLHVLRDDPRLRAFADRELGPLLGYDAEHGTALIADLAEYLKAGGNKALAASRAHLARPTFYQRLRLIERVLGVSLDDPESRASLHVAFLAARCS